MNNLDAQNEEITVLKSIYEEKYFFVECMYPPSGRFSADVQFSHPLLIMFKNHNASRSTETHSHCSKLEYEEFEVKYLPPINLYFEYPESYPTDSPPAFLLTCSWLSYEQLSKLCKQLDILWNDSNGEVILFQWIQFLKEESLSFLGIEKYLDVTKLLNYNVKDDYVGSVPSSTQSKNFISDDNGQNSEEKLKCVSDKKLSNICVLPYVKPMISGGSGARDCRAFLELGDGKALKSLLKDYNEFKKREHFANSWHSCDICLSNKQGSEFVVFKGCHHFFCKDCIKSYFELLITEGSVQSLNCPYNKCSTQADGTLVKQIVNRDLFERYDSLLLARTLETMSDIAYCPRKTCQCPLLIDVSGRMGTCPACNFVFCPFCNMAYHGIAPCNLKSASMQKVCDDYLEGDQDKKVEIENRYGKRAIRALVEECLSDKWIGSNSKNCPTCKASIEKNRRLQQNDLFSM